MFTLLHPTIQLDQQYHTAVDLTVYPDQETTGFSGYTVVTKLSRVCNLLGGARIRLVLRAPHLANGSITACYFGEAATSGNAYDFAASPTAITFGGKAGLTLTAKKVYTSDPAVFEFNAAAVHLIAMNVSSTSMRKIIAPTGVNSGVTSYYKAAVSQASSTTKSSGYTTQSHSAYSLISVQVQRTLNEDPNND